MDRVHLREVRPSHPDRRRILAVVGAVAVVAIVVAVETDGSGLSLDRSSRPAVPAVGSVAMASRAPSAAGALTPTVVQTRAASAAESAAPTGVTTDAAATVAVVAGTWTGTVVAPRSGGRTYTRYDDPSAVTFDTILTIGTCGEGTQCGTLAEHADVWPFTGQPLTCTFALVFRGSYGVAAALSFEETRTAQPAACGAPARLIVTPLTSGQAVAVEEIANGGALDHGVLLQTPTP